MYVEVSSSHIIILGVNCNKIIRVRFLEIVLFQYFFKEFYIEKYVF